MKKNNSLILSAPYIAWMVIFTLIPLGVVAYYAFTDPNTGAFSMMNILELQNYLPVLWQSVLYSLISAVICLLLGYPVAYFIAHQGEVDDARRVLLIVCHEFVQSIVLLAIEREDAVILFDELDGLAELVFREPRLQIGEIKFAHDAPCYGISMKDRSVGFQRQAFESMANGVSQVQCFADAFFERVLLHDVFLDLNGFGHQCL